ncbi:MAG: NEW3 domain-containing protein, partial [Rhodothermales bacterium]|nr:NEW3 domain-containing protein [Rhodothermales bacterium]
MGFNRKRCWGGRIISMLLLSAALTARAGPLDAPSIAVSPGTQGPVTVEPGEIATLVFRVANVGETTRRVSARTSAPAGWQTVTPTGEFELEGQDSTIRLVSIYVPASASPGEHEVTYHARALDGIGNEVESTVTVTVANSPRLSLEFSESAPFVVADRTETITALVTNEGNVDLPVSILARGSNGLVAAASTREVTVPAQSSLPLRLDVSVPDEMTHAFSSRLFVRAVQQ